MDTHRAMFTEAADAKAFILAGNARITLVSAKTGARFTYKVKAAKNGEVHFVGLLSGPDNSSDYQFLGTIFPNAYRHGRKSHVSEDAPSAKAFAWVWMHLNAGRLPEGAEIWHEGRCGKCARVLTVPESIARGLGPICAGAAA